MTNSKEKTNSVFLAGILVFIIAFAFLFMAESLNAQVKRIGVPSITNFLAEDYKANPQNWGLAQDKRGVLYVANNGSVILEYDGASWRSFETGNRSRARSITLGFDGRIYAGAVGDFGYLGIDETGENRFISLIPLVDEDERKFGDVWDTVSSADEVIFLTDNALFVYQDGKVDVVKPFSTFYRMFVFHEKILVQDLDKGLFLLDGFKLEEIEDFSFFAGKKIASILAYDQNTLLVCLRNGMMLLHSLDKQSEVQQEGVLFLEELNQSLGLTEIYSGAVLDENTFAIGTITRGIVVFDKKGQVLQNLDQTKGLYDNTILALLRDRDGALWAATNRALSHIEISSPYSYFGEKTGISGTGLSVTSLNKGGETQFYFGTSEGLFVSTDGINYQRHEGSSTQVFDLKTFDDEVFSIDYQGVLVLSKDKQQRVKLSKIPYHIKKIPDQDKFLVGTTGGFYLLARENGFFHALPVAGFNEQVRLFEFTDSMTVWAYIEYVGVARLDLAPDYYSVKEKIIFSVQDGLPSNRGNLCLLFEGKPIFATSKGFFIFSPEKNRFYPNEELNDLIDREKQVYPVAVDGLGRIWMQNEGQVLLVKRDEHGRLVSDSRILQKLRGRIINNLIRVIDENNVFFGFPEGFIHFDPQAGFPDKTVYRTLIRKVENPKNLDLLFGGNYAPDLPMPKIILPWERNSLRFHFTLPFFENARNNEYSVMLEGMDSDWSSWQKSNYQDYMSLREGAYRFRVRSRNLYEDEGAEASFYFVINPPWFRTWPAYSLFLFLTLFMLAAVFKLYNRKLQAEKEKLEQLVAQRTRELKEATLTDPLTGLRNRRFISEILTSDIKAFVSYKQYLAEEADKRATQNNKNAVFGLFILDIDHFKQVNDTHGHEAGDNLLKQLALLLKSSVREDDTVIRLGGEEFLVILKKTAPYYLNEYAAKIRRLIAETNFELAEKISLTKTCSLGYIAFPVFEKSPLVFSFEQALMLADLGLYYAKNHGRNQAVKIVPLDKIPLESEVKKITVSLDYGISEGFFTIEIH